VDDRHPAEFFAEHECMAIGRYSLLCLLRRAGVASPKPRRAPCHRMTAAFGLQQIPRAHHALTSKAVRTSPTTRALVGSASAESLAAIGMDEPAAEARVIDRRE
jgi:hypothetical protein